MAVKTSTGGSTSKERKYTFEQRSRGGQTSSARRRWKKSANTYDPDVPF